MYQKEMRKRISEHSQRVIQNNDCERRLLDGRMVLMNKEHLRQLRNHDIEMLQLKQEIKMFNNTKREIANETNEGAKMRNRPSTVESIRLVPNKMTRSRTFASGGVVADDKTQRKPLFPQLEETTRDNAKQNSKYEQTATEGDSKDEGYRRRGYTNDDQVMFRRDRRNSYLDKSAGNNSSGQHLPELPKHLQRYDHRSRPADDSRMNGTFKTHGASATQLSMVHSVAWLSFRERQNVMNATYTPDDDNDDDEGDPEKVEQRDKNQSSNDTSLKVEEKSNLISASDPALYSSRLRTGMIDEEDDDDDDIPAYRSQYLSYYSLNRPNFTEVKKTENDLMNIMTRSKIKFGQGRHIAARIERRRLLRSWNARSLPTSQNTDDD